MTHPDGNLPTMPIEAIRSEVNCAQFLDGSVTDRVPSTFAYPNSLAGTPSGPLRDSIRRRYLVARCGMAPGGDRVALVDPLGGGPFLRVDSEGLD